MLSGFPAIPLIIFATLGMTGSLISLLLTETSGKPLQDNMEGKDKDASSVHNKERKSKRKKKKRVKVVPSDDISGQTEVMKYRQVATVERILAESEQNQQKLRQPIIMITRAQSF